MISIKSSINNRPNFTGKVSVPKMILPALGLACCFGTTPIKADTFSKTDSTIVATDSLQSKKYVTQLDSIELAKAPSPIVKIAGKQQKVGIVVDVTENKLYRYNENGKVKDGYHIASGVIGRNGKSITGTGIRQVHHIEEYPYKCAPGSKRSRNPKAYGPNILYLTIVDSKTGEIKGSNGEFIHGNNDASSIGKHASHGCMRMENEVIKQFAKEVKKGTLVLIK